jgi:putative toxin-antitoxin system antitoxin component (TIGR02293 family)
MTTAIRYGKDPASRGKRSTPKVAKLASAGRAPNSKEPRASVSKKVVARNGKEKIAGGKGGKALAPFLAYLHEPAADAIARVRTGFDVSLIGKYAKRIGMPKEEFFILIDLSRSTAHRMEQENKVMDRLRSDAFAGAARVIEKARAMLGSDEATRKWLSTTVPALDFKTPQAWLDTSDGRQIVSSMLDQIQSGTYA